MTNEVDQLMQAAWTKPLPVDTDFRQTRTLPGGQRVPIGPQARGALAVARPGRDGGLVLDEYTRSPWSTIKSQLRQLYMRALFTFQADGTPQTWTVNDKDSNARALPYSDDSTFSNMLSRGTTSDQVQLGYGSDNTAENGGDNSLGTPTTTEMTASQLSYDDTNFTVTASGSRVHTEAGITAAEIGLFSRYQSSSWAFLFDRTVISNTAIATDDVVAVSYEVQF